ncbi:MAG: hypothetical protein HY426_02175 [Candidatus Levybacteria bacterium]|nr:hypothetical protein [Candidatus Levybacteria bacterium]
MNEAEFILKLQERAKEQEKIVRDMPFANVFSTISLWLGHHPWRILVPLAFLITLFLRGLMGPRYTDDVLLVFRWFGL